MFQCFEYACDSKWQRSKYARVRRGTKYAWIYLKKQSAEYARILNVSDAVHSIRSLYKLLSSYRDRRFQNTVKHFRLSVLQKKNNAWEQTHNKCFWGGFVELEHFDKYFVKKEQEKIGSTRKGSTFLSFFSKESWMENITQKWSKSGHFFRFSKNGRKSPSSP